MAYKYHINNLKIEDIDSSWVLDLIQKKFEGNSEIITPLKILSKIGVPINNQELQLEKKNFRLKVKKILNDLCEAGKLEKKESLHDTLGLHEIGYKII